MSNVTTAMSLRSFVERTNEILEQATEMGIDVDLPLYMASDQEGNDFHELDGISVYASEDTSDPSKATCFMLWPRHGSVDPDDLIR